LEDRSATRDTVSWLVRRYVVSRTDVTLNAREQYELAIPAARALVVWSSHRPIHFDSYADSPNGRNRRPVLPPDSHPPPASRRCLALSRRQRDALRGAPSPVSRRVSAKPSQRPAWAS
jgi:hypothetical protein